MLFPAVVAAVAEMAEVGDGLVLIDAVAARMQTKAVSSVYCSVVSIMQSGHPLYSCPAEELCDNKINI